MHQTTIRFGGELWESLQEAAGSGGVSVAQYVREAAIARVAFEAGRANERAMRHAIETAKLSRERAAWLADESEAVQRQSELAQRRARSLRDKS